MSELSDAYEAIWDGVLGCYDSESFTWSGTSYACASAELTDALLHEMPGTIDDSKVTLGVKRSLFNGTEPVADDTITYQGVDRVIDTVARSFDNTVLFITLKQFK